MMNKKNILLVGNDETVDEMQADLMKWDYGCISVQNSDEGILYVEGNSGGLDMLIIDLCEPDVKGMEMLKYIENSSKHRNLPVLVIAASDRLEDIACAFETGADDVIVKPLNQDITKKRIENVICVSGSRIVHNVMEDLVRSAIDEYVDSLGICTCPICRRDLLTLTLNHVQPQYVTSEKGAAITKAQRISSREENIKLLTEITYYAQMVKNRPNHG